ncbi:MAG: R3H domain-containing nucleic acid-binding protein [Bryobacterales bacterium]|nr:R3H domain-containing nucleic acid-binding protein [Bryobacterales bacterium]
MPDTKYTVEQHGEQISDFLATLIRNAGFDLQFTVSPPAHIDPDFENPDLKVELKGRDSDLLLANKGEALLAFEMLTLEVIGVPGDEHSRIAFDCDNYRYLRMQELRMTATAAGDRVVQTNKAFTFNPMNSRERRMIHLALRNRPEVRSESASSLHGRYVVIYPAAMATPEEPPPPPGSFYPAGGREGGPPSRGFDDRRRGPSDRPRRDGPRSDRSGGDRSGGDRPRGGRGPRRSD